MNSILKNIGGVLAGIVIAAILVLCALGLLALSFRFFPALGLERVEWTHWMTVIVIPETLFIVAAVKLWRKRRPLAVGIGLSAIVLATHFVIHVSTNIH